MAEQDKSCTRAKLLLKFSLNPSQVPWTYEDESHLVPSPIPLVMRGLIPEEEQREIFKWMLEEKRKMKPKDPTEKKQIDEENAILKQFIRAKSIPKL